MWWQQVISDVIGAGVLYGISQVPRIIRSAVRREMLDFCAHNCPVRSDLERRVSALEAK